MTRALSYSAPVTTLSLLTAPSGTVIAGQQAATAFAVQVLRADGVTPVVGEAITFTATGGTAQFSACGATVCAVPTDARGVASTLITPEASGGITLEAAGVDGTATVSLTALIQVRTATAVQPVEYIAAGVTVAWTPQLSVADNIASTNGLIVNWQTVSGSVTALPNQSEVDATGVARTLATAGPLAPGAQALLSGCAWTTVCATFTTQGVDPEDLRVIAVSGGGQSRPGQRELHSGRSPGHGRGFESCCRRRGGGLSDGGCVAAAMPRQGTLSYPSDSGFVAVFGCLRCERAGDDNRGATAGVA